MAELFNPYLKWLGIALEDQPPNHYRLLGIPELIDDPDVIDNAANRQMGHVRTFATGKHTQLSQQLLNEIAAAKVCLLSPEKKKAYDQQLRQAAAQKAEQAKAATTGATSTPVLHTRPLPQATAIPAAQPAPILTTDEADSVTKRVRKGNSRAMQVAVVVALLVVAGIAIWRVTRSAPEEAPVAQHDPEVIAPAVSPAENSTNKTLNESVDPPTKSQTEPPAEVDKSKIPPPVETTPTITRTPNVKETASDAPENANEEGNNNNHQNGNDNNENNDLDKPSKVVSTGKAMDLLKQIDPARDSLTGTWTLGPLGLVSPSQDQPIRLLLPGEVPKQYALTMDVERIQGENMLFIALMIGGKHGEVFLDWHARDKAPISGFFFSGSELGGYPDPVFKPGHISRIECIVTEKRVLVLNDGKVILDQSDRLNEITVNENWALPRKDALCLGSFESSFRFTKIELAPILNADTAVASAGKEESTSKPIDLLKEMDLARDTIDGRWTIIKNALISTTSSEYGRVNLIGLAPDEYELAMEVERASGDNMFCICMPVAGKQVEVFFDWHRPGEEPYSGFIPVDKYPTHRGLLFPDARRKRVQLRVTKDRVEVLIDGKSILDVRERLNEMSLIGNWAGPKPDAIVLGTQNSGFRFTKLELTPLGDGRAGPAGTPRANVDVPIAKKLPIPADAELEKAQATLREIFQAEIAAAKSPEQQSALAKTFLGQVSGNKQSPAEAFVLLRAAKTMAVKGADSETAMAVIDKLAERFEIDSLGMKAETLTDLGKSAKATTEQMALIMAIGEVVRELVEVDRFDEAEPLTKLAQSAALKTGNVQLRKELAVSVKEFDGLQKAYRSAQPAIEKLKQLPDDAAANLEVGRYRAFVKNDWPAGLKNLAAGSDASLRELAAEDLAGTGDAAEQVKLADAWYDAAKAETGDSQKGFKIRAGHWYELALPELSGLSRQHALKRLDEIRELNPVGAMRPQDWKVWVMDNGRMKDIQAKNLSFEDGQLSLKNDNLGFEVLLVYQPFVSNRPFLATFELKGNPNQMGLISADRLGPAIISWGTRDQDWHAVSIEQQANKKIRITIDGKDMEVRYWKTDENLQGMIAIWLTNQEACSIRRFELQTNGRK